MRKVKCLSASFWLKMNLKLSKFDRDDFSTKVLLAANRRRDKGMTTMPKMVVDVD